VLLLKCHGALLVQVLLLQDIHVMCERVLVADLQLVDGELGGGHVRVWVKGKCEHTTRPYILFQRPPLRTAADCCGLLRAMRLTLGQGSGGRGR
jgi:hypothetical protein